MLNDAYQPAQMTFQLREKVRIISSTWALNEDDSNMRRSLHKGDKSTLNLYFLESICCPEAGEVNLGSAAFPDWLQHEDGLNRDCVLINIDTLPGGRFSWRGKSVIHEVGHWIGLLHTFQGGCEDGDGISDTWAEEKPSRACEPRDSCPDKPGMDNINNYMNYSPE